MRTSTPRPTRRARRACALAATGAAAALAVGAAPATAAPAQSTKGTVKAGGMDVTFSATRAAGAVPHAATGSFVAEGVPAAVVGVPSDVGRIRLSGPISCLQTRGEDVSFYYEFDDRSTSGLPGGLRSGMLVTLKKPTADRYTMGFLPRMSAMVPLVGCDVDLAPLAVTSGGWQNGR